MDNNTPPLLLQVFDTIGPIVSTVIAPAVGWMIKVLIDIRNGQTRTDEKCAAYDRRIETIEESDKDIYARLNAQGEKIAEIGARVHAGR